MAKGKIKKYIESHWLVFALEGAIGLLLGWYLTFTGITETATLVTVVACVLLFLGLVDAFNLLYKKRVPSSWGLTIILTLLEVGVSLGLLFTRDQNAAVHLAILAGYSMLRGLLEILIGFKSLSDSTDRFMWIVCGICGCVLGFVILNSGNFASATTFVKFFGTYMMIYGVTNLIYGVHNKNALADSKRRKNSKSK